MNLFYLDYDLDLNAEYHIDKHVLKMQLEAAQMLASALWVDKLIGFVPRKLDSLELAVIKKEMQAQPTIENRTFIRYKVAHPNHPTTVWVRSSYDNYQWTQVYMNSLNEEAIYRGYKSHKSCIEANSWPEPNTIPSLGVTTFAQAMPDQYKRADPVEAYRAYYMGEKSHLANWKYRERPNWYTS
jgi:hypothetical protein